MRRNTRKLFNEIYYLLKDNPTIYFTINDIAERVHSTSPTTKGIIEILEDLKLVFHKKIGKRLKYRYSER